VKFINKASLYDEIQKIREEYGISGPADPYAPAKRLGITVSVYEFDSRRLSGLLLRGKNTAEIVVNSSRGAEARRFTVAHELVHYFLHGGTSFMCLDQNNVTALEWQANEGAAELLLPYRSFLSSYINIRSLYLSDEDKAVRRLAKEFSVTPAAARLRLETLGPEIAQLESGISLEKVRPISRRVAAPARRPTIDVVADDP